MTDNKDAEKKLADQRKETEERVSKAYEHEDPTPTQAENDAAKLAALNQDPPEGGASTHQNQQNQQNKKTSEAGAAGSNYATRATTAKTQE